MKGSTTEIEYEGSPLLLRRPDHQNIWHFYGQFTQLVAIQHILEEVTSNGLPVASYNNTLADFDHYMCTLFDDLDSGIIFLIETSGGKRRYYFYIHPDFDIASLTKKAKLSYNVKLELTIRNDDNWNFLKEYPLQLFEK